MHAYLRVCLFFQFIVYNCVSDLDDLRSELCRHDSAIAGAGVCYPSSSAHHVHTDHAHSSHVRF